MSAASLALCLFIGGCYLTSPVEKLSVSVDNSAVSTTTTAVEPSGTSVSLIPGGTTTASSSTTTAKPTASTTDVKTNTSPTIRTQPVSVAEVEIGDIIQYSVGVSGGRAPYTYQWQRYQSNDWTNITQNALVNGENTSTLSLMTDAISGAPTDALSWIRNAKVRCKVTDAVGNSVYSNAAALKMKFVAYIVPDEYTAHLLYVRTLGGEGTRCSYQWEYFDPSGLQAWMPATSYTGRGVILLPSPSNKLPFAIGDSLHNASTEFRYRCTVTDSSGKVIMTEEFEFEEVTS